METKSEERKACSTAPWEKKKAREEAQAQHDRQLEERRTDLFDEAWNELPPEELFSVDALQDEEETDNVSEEAQGRRRQTTFAGETWHYKKQRLGVTRE